MIPDFPIDIRSWQNWIFFCCFLTLLIFWTVGWSQQNWPSQQGRKFPSNLGFRVSDLVYILIQSNKNEDFKYAWKRDKLKYIYSEKDINFCKISTLFLPYLSSTSKWPSEPQFCERYYVVSNKMARNGRKLAS